MNRECLIDRLQRLPQEIEVAEREAAKARATLRKAREHPECRETIARASEALAEARIRRNTGHNELKALQAIASVWGGNYTP